MNGFRGAAGQLQGLDEQIRDGEKALTQAREEANGLRQENLALRERIERRDRRITGLLKEKYALEGLLRARSAEVLELRSKKKGAECELEVANTGRKVRRPSGFTLASTDDLEDKKRKDSIPADQSKSHSLQEWAAAHRPSEIEPEVLRTASWLLTEVPEEDRTGYKDYEGQGQEARGDRDDDGSNIKRERRSTLSSRSRSPTRGRSPKRARLQDQETASTARGRSPTARHMTNTSGSPLPQAHHRFRSRGYLGPRTSPSSGRLRRKAVCVHCWETSSLCDRSPRCRTCRRENMRCVRKLCEEGERCGNVRCPCLHPGEWNEGNDEFEVERGELPRRRR